MTLERALEGATTRKRERKRHIQESKTPTLYFSVFTGFQVGHSNENRKLITAQSNSNAYRRAFVIITFLVFQLLLYAHVCLYMCMCVSNLEHHERKSK